MKIAIVDDEPIWRSRAEEKVRAFYSFPIEVQPFASGEEFLAYDSRIAAEGGAGFDIVFLDIEMKGALDGFETTVQFKNRHPQVPVILLTAHGEFSRRGYRVKAFRYLEKQYLDEIDEALESIGVINPEDSWFNLLQSDGSSRMMRTIDIHYLEAVPHGVSAVTEEGVIRSCCSLQNCEQQLASDDHFYRCHQAFLINWKYVKEVDGQDVVMEDGVRIPVSRRRQREAQSRYIKYHFRRASR